MKQAITIKTDKGYDREICGATRERQGSPWAGLEQAREGSGKKRPLPERPEGVGKR